MRTRTAIALLVSIAGLCTSQVSADPLNTTFTYQGELTSSGTAANGIYDITVRLFDAATAGNQVGSTFCANNVQVTNGIFTLPLDFGAQLNGQRRWVEIQVRADTGLNCSVATGYTLLTPRQELTASPYALYAPSAGVAATATSATSASVATNAAQLNGQTPAFYLNAANLTGNLGGGRLAGEYANALNFSNVGNSYAGSGANLVNLNAANLASGTIGDARLSSNVALKNANNTFTGINTFPSLLLNATQQIGAGSLTIRGPFTGSSYNGMYVDSPDAAGWPFYGYATAGDYRAWTWYQGDTGNWNLYNNGQKLTVTSAGRLGFNTTTPLQTVDIVGFENFSGTNASLLLRPGYRSDVGINLAAAASATGPAAFYISQYDVAAGTYADRLTVSTSGTVGIPTDIDMIQAHIGNYSYGNGREVHGVQIGSTEGSNVRLVSQGSFSSGATLRFGDADYVYLQETNDDALTVHARLGINFLDAISAPAKNFLIDHPSDPANMTLRHASIESDEYKNLYDGTATLETGGTTTITLPSWFSDLNENFRYQLTCIGGWAPVYISDELSDNHFTIAGGAPGMKVSWQITGNRKDAWAKAHPMQVEEQKTDAARGKFMHPVEHGQTADKGMYMGMEPKTEVKTAPAGR